MRRPSGLSVVQTKEVEELRDVLAIARRWKEQDVIDAIGDEVAEVDAVVVQTVADTDHAMLLDPVLAEMFRRYQHTNSSRFDALLEHVAFNRFCIWLGVVPELSP